MYRCTSCTCEPFKPAQNSASVCVELLASIPQIMSSMSVFKVCGIPRQDRACSTANCYISMQVVIVHGQRRNFNRYSKGKHIKRGQLFRMRQAIL